MWSPPPPPLFIMPSPQAKENIQPSLSRFSFSTAMFDHQPSSCCCLKLFGSWASSYTHRVQLALKLKGLEFEYVEEDLANKSPSLLLHNPVYKKVPVLLHDGRPVTESLVILQYLDDVAWTGGIDAASRLIVPVDPYDKALALFWSHFVNDKLGPAVGAVFASTGEEQKAAVDQVHSNLKLIEAELRDGAFKGRRFFGGERIGLLDIVLGCGSYWLSVFEEVADVKLVDPDAFPLFHSWLREFEEQEEVKETIPAYDRLIEYAAGVRHELLSMKGAATAAAAAAEAETNDHSNGSSEQKSSSNMVKEAAVTSET